MKRRSDDHEIVLCGGAIPTVEVGDERRDVRERGDDVGQQPRQVGAALQGDEIERLLSQRHRQLSRTRANLQCTTDLT